MSSERKVVPVSEGVSFGSEPSGPGRFRRAVFAVRDGLSRFLRKKGRTGVVVVAVFVVSVVFAAFSWARVFEITRPTVLTPGPGVYAVDSNVNDLINEYAEKVLACAATAADTAGVEAEPAASGHDGSGPVLDPVDDDGLVGGDVYVPDSELSGAADPDAGDVPSGVSDDAVASLVSVCEAAKPLQEKLSDMLSVGPRDRTFNQ